jgi:hypothetical protein
MNGKSKVLKENILMVTVAKISTSIINAIIFAEISIA